MKKIILHPFLFAVYPIIFLYSYNAQELLINQIYLPIIISLLSTLVIWGIMGLLIKDRIKAGLITTVFLLVFFGYGYTFDLLRVSGVIAVKHRHLLPVFVLLLGYIIYFIHLSKKNSALEILSRTLNLMGIVLIIINLINIVSFEVKKMNLQKQTYTSDNVKTNLNNADNYPDIYFIIMDEYASLDTIKNIWGYDNSWFADSLKQKGFYVAEKSTVKYYETTKAIPSYLNMEYVDSKLDMVTCFQKLNNNQVSEYLMGMGYEIVAFDNLYALNPGKGKFTSDYQFDFKEAGAEVKSADDFSMILINNTMLRAFNYLFKLSYTYNMSRNATLYTLSKLKEIPTEVPDPKFVYVHLLCPHTPFVFDIKGKEVDPVNNSNWRDKKYYLEQYIYITKEMEKTIDEILKNSKTPPVIILQSDHGPRGNSSPNPSENIDIPTEEKLKIFNAYYLPNVNKNILKENVSPINTFRIIFNTYFKDKFELLED